ncbi:MAG TPA: exonuclease SbcCD subunit D [Chloroflexota bacterium]|jgi:DNA repair exonuclease SbcCD nuclease subunit|nr:exonuclease SbcCD subunit D [Chloroflexota bacterium]
MTKFIHAGDIHLGNEQYGLPERTTDFNRAFLKVVDHAVRTQVDFVLLTGDLLNKASQADALALLQASVGLERLRKANIPVVAIEGNHEWLQKADTVSFPAYLSLIQLVHLLDFQIDKFGDKTLPPWDDAAWAGGYIDIGTTRIFGVRYMGAQTAQTIQEIAQHIHRGNAEFVILMLHAGMEGEIPHMHGGLTMAQLAPLRGKVDYIALGHVHKKLEREGWIFNPGSTEICGFDEVGPDWPHGFFEVEVVDGRARAEHHATASRPFVRINVDVDGAENPDTVLTMTRAAIIRARDLADGAIVEITLMGVTPFNRHEIQEEIIRAAVDARCDPLSVKIRYSVTPLKTGFDRSQLENRSELESEVIHQLVRQIPEYRNHAREWTRIALEVKELINDRRPPAAIAEHVQRSRERLEREAPSTARTDDEAETTDQVGVVVEEPAAARQLGLPV